MIVVLLLRQHLPQAHAGNEDQGDPVVQQAAGNAQALPFLAGFQALGEDAALPQLRAQHLLARCGQPVHPQKRIGVAQLPSHAGFAERHVVLESFEGFLLQLGAACGMRHCPQAEKEQSGDAESPAARIWWEQADGRGPGIVPNCGWARHKHMLAPRKFAAKR